MNKRSSKTNSTWFVDCHFTSVCKINAMPTRQRGQHVMRFLTWGNVDDLFDDGILGLLVLFPALGVLLIDGAQFTADMWKCAWMRTDNQLTERGHGSPAADVRCVTQWDRPVGETHSVFLNIQRGEFLVVPQSLLFLAGDSQVKTQHGIWLQFHRLTSIQTLNTCTLQWAQT